jgi:hypothetical protein
MSADFRFNAMYFLPYIHLPRNHKKYNSTWVDFPKNFTIRKRATNFISGT